VPCYRDTGFKFISVLLGVTPGSLAVMTSSAAPTDLLLAEELLLLVLDDEKGHNTAQGADSGLAGALLLDLAAGGWIDAADDKLIPAVPPPSGQAPAEVLADALAAIQAEAKPRDAKHWVRKLPNELRPIKGRVATRLVERGVLSEQRRKVLGLVSVERYSEADPEPERALRERLRAELTGTGDVSPRTALLVPLLRAYNLVAKLVAKDERKAANRRAKDIAEDPGKVGGAVSSVLSDALVAIYVSVGTALAISVSSDGGGGGGDGGG
jgi:hypothetical protein